MTEPDTTELVVLKTLGWCFDFNILQSRWKGKIIDSHHLGLSFESSLKDVRKMERVWFCCKYQTIFYIRNFTGLVKNLTIFI